MNATPSKAAQPTTPSSETKKKRRKKKKKNESALDNSTASVRRNLLSLIVLKLLGFDFLLRPAKLLFIGKINNQNLFFFDKNNNLTFCNLKGKYYLFRVEFVNIL